LLDLRHRPDPGRFVHASRRRCRQPVYGDDLRFVDHRADRGRFVYAGGSDGGQWLYRDDLQHRDHRADRRRHVYAGHRRLPATAIRPPPATP
jgi:hypothetical protein